MPKRNSGRVYVPEDLSDLRFRRQFPIGNFIADFACPKARLVIELDGAQRLDRTAQDAWRTKLIEQRGYKVIRFWDSEVLADIAGVLERIEQALCLRVISRD